jgi:putative methyltransferase (TIGR04325 family)
MIIKNLKFMIMVNPILLYLRKKIFEKKFANHQNVNYFRGHYDSFQQAIASSPKTKPIGYDNENAAQMYKERTEKIYPTDYPVLYWMQKYKENIKNVFDFGGHIGVHYYSYSRYLNYSKLNKWTVCDVESVINEGKKIASTQKTESLSFVTDIDSCENYDLLLISGSLQYLEWELHTKLQNLKIMPKFIIVNMLPLHPNYKTITLQSIGTSFCPYHIRRKDEFITGLNEIGYDLVDIWKNEEKKCNIEFEPTRSLDYYNGAFFIYKSVSKLD